jgi:hypothetical protein
MRMEGHTQELGGCLLKDCIIHVIGLGIYTQSFTTLISPQGGAMTFEMNMNFLNFTTQLPYVSPLSITPPNRSRPSPHTLPSRRPNLTQLNTKLPKITLCRLLQILLHDAPILFIILRLHAHQMHAIPMQSHQSRDK